MLVLTRKAGERLLIGDDIVIYFLRSNDIDFRVGIEAPKDVKVIRQEVAERNDLEWEKAGK